MNLPATEPLLEIKGLKTYFYMKDGIAKAVDNVSLEIKPGETLGIAGESGCGKSVTALSIIRLLQEPPARIVGGRIHFSTRGDLTKLSQAEMRKIRGNEISMIFQEPMTSLNPVFRIGRQMSETIKVHQNVSAKEALNRTVELLKMVGLSAPEKQVKDYPHQLSGGMRQRVMIAMALSCNPKLMLADEPTTALDVTIQAQILNLMNELKERIGTSILLITHDLDEDGFPVIAKEDTVISLDTANREVIELASQNLLIKKGEYFAHSEFMIKKSGEATIYSTAQGIETESSTIKVEEDEDLTIKMYTYPTTLSIHDASQGFVIAQLQDSSGRPVIAQKDITVYYKVADSDYSEATNYSSNYKQKSSGYFQISKGTYWGYSHYSLPEGIEDTYELSISTEEPLVAETAEITSKDTDSLGRSRPYRSLLATVCGLWVRLTR